MYQIIGEGAAMILGDGLIFTYCLSCFFLLRLYLSFRFYLLLKKHNLLFTQLTIPDYENDCFIIPLLSPGYYH